MSRIDRLLESGLRLQSEVLEARAGLSMNFDAMNAAVLALRSAEASASTVRERGLSYADAASSLEETAETLRHDEVILERFKSDLSLLHLSTRYFPCAADALGQRLVRSSDASTEPSTGKSAWANTLGSLAMLGELRAGVGRYEAAPTKDNALMLQESLRHATELSVERSTALQPELAVLLGHARSILARRELVDGQMYTLLQSPLVQHLQAALAAFQGAAERQTQRVVLLRLLSIELFALGLGAVLGSVFVRLRAGQRGHP